LTPPLETTAVSIINHLKNTLYSGTSRSLVLEKSNTVYKVMALKRYGTSFGCKYTMVTESYRRLISNKELTEYIDSILNSENMGVS